MLQHFGGGSIEIGKKFFTYVHRWQKWVVQCIKWDERRTNVLTEPLQSTIRLETRSYTCHNKIFLINKKM